MSQFVIGVLGTLIAFCVMLIGLASYRHNVRRAEVLDLREQQLQDRERRAEGRIIEAELREERSQASLITVDVRIDPSPLHDGWTSVQLVISNRSSQPIRELAARYWDEPVTAVSGDIGPGSSICVAMPSAEGKRHAWAVLPGIELDFTDSADVRWRSQRGGLRRGHVRDEDGEWEWGEREQPMVHVLHPAPRDDAFQQEGGGRLSKSARSLPTPTDRGLRGFGKPVVGLGLTLLVLLVVLWWWLLR